MACEEQQAALDAEIQAIAEIAKEETDRLTAEADAALKNAGEALGEDGLSGAVGAAVGGAIGSTAGPGGTAVGAVIGRELGKLFVISVEMRRTRMVIGLPTVRMTSQRVAFDLPSVTMRNRDIIFHLPSVRMNRVKIGEKPETTCSGGGWLGLPQCTVRWTPIWADVPEPYMQENRIVLAIPEITMQRNDWRFDVPDVRIEDQEILFDVPSIKIESRQDAAERAADAALELTRQFQDRAAGLAKAAKERAKDRIAPRISGVFACHRANLEQQLVSLPQRFDPVIDQLNGAISGMAGRGVPSTDDDYAQMVAQRDAMLQQRRTLVDTLHAQIADLSAKEAEAINALIAS
ncbi:MAG TPA: hypothetical protein VFV30_04915 [Novosphingobium sp.]|nr:hypothetical protein [Novosphingobium sp.]